MARKRKRRIFPFHTPAVDICDIETQVEIDRLRELEHKNKNSFAVQYFLDKGKRIKESCGGSHGSVQSIISKESESQLNTPASSKSNAAKHGGHISFKKLGNDQMFSCFNDRNNRNIRHDDNKLTSVLPNDDNSSSVSASDRFLVDSEFLSSNATDITNEHCSDQKDLCPYITLNDLTALEEDVDCLEIDGNLIVQNYLRQLEATNDVVSIESNFTPNKPKCLLSSQTLAAEKGDFLTSQFRRKSSLRKKSSDESYKASVSFQVPNDTHSKRSKSVCTTKDADRANHVPRPSTASCRMQVKGDSNQSTENRNSRRIPESSHISKYPKSHESTHLSCDDYNLKNNKPRKTSAVSRTFEISYTSRQKCPSATFDPELEKASTYIHGGNKQFSRANTSITPAKYGLKHLQMNYSENTLEHNQSVIFMHLLKDSCNKSQIQCAEIRNVERRLELRRTNPLYSTTFYEQKKIVDPYRVQIKKVARTVAQKKKERKEKIKKMTDEMMGDFVPTCLTMKIADQNEVEDIGRNCRYLRCNPPPPRSDEPEKEPVEGIVTKTEKNNDRT